MTLYDFLYDLSKSMTLYDLVQTLNLFRISKYIFFVTFFMKNSLSRNLKKQKVEMFQFPPPLACFSMASQRVPWGSRASSTCRITSLRPTTWKKRPQNINNLKKTQKNLLSGNLSQTSQQYGTKVGFKEQSRRYALQPGINNIFFVHIFFQ